MAYNRARQTNAMRKALNKQTETVKPVQTKPEQPKPDKPVAARPLDSGNYKMIGGEKVRILNIPKYTNIKTAKQLHLEHLARQGIIGKKIHETAFSTNPFIAGGKKKIVDQSTIGPGSVYEHFDAKTGKPIMKKVHEIVGYDKQGKPIFSKKSKHIQQISVQEKETSRYWKRRNREKKNAYTHFNDVSTGLAVAKKQAFKDFVSDEVANKNQEFHLRLMKEGKYQGYEGQKIDTDAANRISFHYNETHPDSKIGIGESGSFHPVLGVATFFKHEHGMNTNYYKKQAREFNDPVGTGVKSATRASKHAEVLALSPSTKTKERKISPNVLHLDQPKPHDDAKSMTAAGISLSTNSGLSYSAGLPLDIQMGIAENKTEHVVSARSRVIENHNAMDSKAKDYEKKFETANEQYFKTEAVVRTTGHTPEELKKFAAARLAKKNGLKIKAKDVTDKQMEDYIKAVAGEKAATNYDYSDSDYKLVAKLAQGERDKVVTKNTRPTSHDNWKLATPVGKMEHINPERTWENMAKETISNKAPEYSMLDNKNPLQSFMMMNNRKGIARKVNKAIGKKPKQIKNPIHSVTQSEQLQGQVTPQNPSSIKTGSIHSPITQRPHIDKKLRIAITTGDFRTADYTTPSVPSGGHTKVEIKKPKSMGSVKSANSFTTVFASDIANNARGTAGAAARAQIKIGTTKKGKK